MNNAMMKKLRRKPQWKLQEERDELQLEQRQLRTETGILKARLNELRDNRTKASQANDESSLAVTDNLIEFVETKISENDKRYKTNAEVLEIYSKVVKNDKEGKSLLRNSLIGAATGLGGLALAAIGLKKAYQSDLEGTLVNKKTLEWVSKLPIMRSFGRLK